MRCYEILIKPFTRGRDDISVFVATYFADMLPFISFFGGPAVDYTEDIMKHEDHHDKELSHLIRIVKTSTKSKMEYTGSAKRNEQIGVAGCF